MKSSLQTVQPAGYPSPVLSLSVVDQASCERGRLGRAAKILLAVRRPGINATHPNVISVPTQRMPPGLFEDILSRAQVEARQENTTFYRGDDRSRHARRGHDPLAYAVNSLLARKLGMAEGLESGALRYQASLAAVTAGKTEYPNLPPEEREEHISMMNVMVVISQGADRFPDSTLSYSRIFWASIGNFLKAIRDKDPFALKVDLREEEYRIGGLCTLAAYNFLTYKLAPVKPGLTYDSLAFGIIL